MLSFKDQNRYSDYLARIISLAVYSKVHLVIVTDRIAKSSFIEEMESGNNSIIYNKTPYELFFELFGIGYVSDNSYMNYNNAYWCGWVYSQIMFEFRKPFSYISLKMPLSRLLEMYPVYHEMDISQIFEEFKKAQETETIMNLVLKKHSLKATELSRRSGVALRTIARFKEKDEYLYKGSYNNIFAISKTLREPGSLFFKECTFN